MKRKENNLKSLCLKYYGYRKENEIIECPLQDPLATDVAEQWKTNEAEAIRTAKEWTRAYAR